ncbi:hypothetical protein [Listeria welshimeri]|uniref:hypothetical protein n=1 Tax=Listeria welshimeri TaxID=1643 RepID=UPI00188971CA|nr:hypothetical protein [Listeria welshimeri]MBF2598297.1 hypothetical protein [Listeria welshimeri]MBF2614912.1 hypothetical protein [Listeria welshimeri]
MENLKTNINNIYKDDLELAKKERREPFYILVGYELTTGLLNVIERKPNQNVSISSILDYYKMDTQELYDFVLQNRPEIPEFFSMVAISLETFADVQEYNFRLLNFILARDSKVNWRSKKWIENHIQ